MKQQFYSNSKVPQVNLLFCGEEHCSPSHEFGGHRPYLILHIVRKGRGSFSWRSKSWFLGEGDAFLIFPEEVHLYQADAVDPWHYFWLALDRSIVPYLEDQGFSQESPILRSSDPDKIYCLYKSMIPGREEREAGWDLKQYAAVYGILADLLSHRENRGAVLSPSVRPDHVKAMTTFMGEYFHTPIAVQDVADYVHLERTYASRIFKTETGYGIAGYIRILRLEKSREYLLKGFSVKQAAYSSGFQVYENFLKLFKKTYGLSPGVFQKDQGIRE